MKKHCFILFPGPSTWRVGVVGEGDPTFHEVAVSSDATAVASAVADALNTAGYRGQGVMLALPSQWCLCAPIDSANLPAKNRRAALAYRFEEKLPLAAEDVIADYLPSPAGEESTLAIGVQKTLLAPVVQALESSGIDVTAICPASLLALQYFVTHSPLSPPAAHDAILWPTAVTNEIELFILRAGTPCGWHIFPGDPKALHLHLDFEFPPPGDSSMGARSIAAIDFPLQLRSTITDRADLVIHDIKAPPLMKAASLLAASILSGKVAPWIDLRRDALASRQPLRQVRTPLTAAVAALIVFLLVACGAMFWRASRYDAQADRYASEQQSVFRQAFPTGAIPADVRSRLESEERNLRGQRGETSAPPPSQAGLVTLRDLLAHLPPEEQLRYRVLELRLDDRRFTLDGQAATHGDADVIANALRKDKSFIIEPPRTEQLGANDDSSASKSTGVSFTITGDIASQSPSVRKGAP